MLTTHENYDEFETLSQSELYLLNRCKKAHSYSYREGLVPAATPDYFTKGTFVHQIQARILRGDIVGTEGLDQLSLAVQTEQLNAQEPTVNEAVRTEVVWQLTDFWNDVGIPSLDNVVAVEEEVYADLNWTDATKTTVLFHGFIDGVVRDDEGNLWIVEHKTAARAWSQNQFEFSYQGKLYAEAWERLTGERPMGIQYNFFYPKRWEIKLQYVTEQESTLLLDEIQQSITLRDVMREADLAPREPKWGCGDCRYRNLCFAELVGLDANYLRETEFKVDEKRMR